MNIQQVVLPFYDPEVDRRGFQFGLPAQNMGINTAVSRYRDLCVLKLFQNGEVEFINRPLLAAPEGSNPGQPAWFWVAFDINNGIEYGHVVPPVRGKTSVPLNELRQETRIYSPYGNKKANRSPLISDLSEDIQVPEDFDHKGSRAVKLRDCEILKFSWENRFVTHLTPRDFAFRHSLWTSHLARLVYVTLATKRRLQKMQP